MGGRAAGRGAQAVAALTSHGSDARARALAAPLCLLLGVALPVLPWSLHLDRITADGPFAGIATVVGVGWLATLQVVELENPAETAVQNAIMLWVPTLLAGFALAWLYGRWARGRHARPGRAPRGAPAGAAAAAGAVEYLPLALAGGLPAAIARMRDAGLHVVGLDGAADVSLADMAGGDGPVCLVLGAEGRGLSRLVRERCDEVVSIPMRGRLSSLNVSAAAALACFEIARRR